MFKKFLGFKPQLLPTLFTIPALILLFSLSIWQFYRLDWKQDLVKEITERIALPEIELPQKFTLEDMLYRKVSLHGKFLNDYELYLYGGSIEFKGQNGYYILTPFKTDDNRMVIINRGWIPEKIKDQTSRPETLINDEAQVNGYVLKDEHKGIYTHDNQPDKNLWFYINLQEIKDYLKMPIEDFYILSEYKPKTLPIGRDVTPNIRNNHLGYALTWLFAAFSLIVIYIMYHKKKNI